MLSAKSSMIVCNIFRYTCNLKCYTKKEVIKGSCSV
jgi:hypothetical protein